MVTDTRHLPQRKVLMVEDVDVCGNLLESILIEIPGVEILRVESGIEALRLLDDASLNICVLVTDLNMPVLDGFELIARVRSSLRYGRLPIIVVSADVNPLTPRRVQKLGVEAFFAKPYSPASVRRSVEGLLERAGEGPLS